MHTKKAIEELKYLLENELPGEAAHVLMAPLSRPLSSLALKEGKDIRQSSVAIVLIEQEEELQIVLIQRPDYVGNHSGQVSFPGGKQELSDKDLVETAIRECFEEIGVRLEFEHFLGKLSPVYIPVSNFRVDANVFYLDSRPDFVKDPREVDAIFTIRVNDLLQDEFVRKVDMQVQTYTLKDVPYFALENKQIWGATALILSELKEIFRQIKI